MGREAARRLAQRRHGEVCRGLSEAELARVEVEFGIEFADDHRSFLSAGLPVGRSWPDWRDGDRERLRERLAWPVEGVLFDVHNNVFWYENWGERPADVAEAVTVAREHLAGVPAMVPVCSHRYLPAGRGTYGHPVLSMYQTDIICYGVDLVDYMYQEFKAGSGIEMSDPRWRPHPTVPFWRELVE